MKQILFMFILFPLMLNASVWSDPVRGSWLRYGKAQIYDLKLVSGNEVCEIVVGMNEGSIVRQAAVFLAEDIKKITGKKPAIVEESNGKSVAVRLVTSGNSQVAPELKSYELEGKWESYIIVNRDKDLWLVGSDPRGTAFAVYTLCERLGIDPLYHWTGYRPERRNPLVLKKTKHRVDSPVFRFRGMFHDDEDILPRPFDDKGYPYREGDVPLEWYKKFFETALRLRMNMTAPYTRVNRRFEVQKMASDWGLFYTSHHYDVLLSNPWWFTRGMAEKRGVEPVWDWFKNSEGMLRYWECGVVENKSLDAIWPVGLRNTADKSFDFPDDITMEQKNNLFRDVIQKQVEIVKRNTPKEKQTPLFTFTLYAEMLNIYYGNPDAFQLPDDVIIIWVDDDEGIMRALPKQTGKWKHGVYYHLAYWWGQKTKQLTQVVPPSIIASEFEKIIRSGATEYMLVNVSELRDFVKGTRMIADICWDANHIYNDSIPDQKFTNWWIQEYFVSEPTKQKDLFKLVKDSYADYYKLIDRPNRLWFAANVIEQLIESLYEKVSGRKMSNFALDNITEIRERIKLQEKTHEKMHDALSMLTMSQQRFFSVDVQLGFLIDYRHSRAALLLHDALLAESREILWEKVFAARNELEKLQIEISRCEYPPFDRWYQETWLRQELNESNPHRSYKQLRSFISKEGIGRIEKLRQQWFRRIPAPILNPIIP